jgi:hypothetical protein
VTSANPMSDSRFVTLVQLAFKRLRAKLIGSDSVLFENVWPWMTQLSGSSSPEDYYLKPGSAPILFLPWCLELSLTSNPEQDFQTDLIYATVNKYYSVRLLDDVMDGHGIDRCLLPMLAIWDAEFQATYSRHFPPEHTFWDYFHETLLRAASVTARETMLTHIDRNLFFECSAAKSCGATIALMAVCCRRGRLDVFPAWVRFWNAFASWNQMRDDLRDWYGDSKGGIRSYLLSEGERGKYPKESLEEWFLREGCRWATRSLGELTRQMKDDANYLNSPDMKRYVESRAADLDREIAKITAGVEALAALSSLEL